MSSVLISTAELTATREKLAVRTFVLAFESFRGRRQMRASVRAAVTYRLGDPNITELERTRLQRLTG